MKWGVYEILVRNGVSACAKCGRVLPIAKFRRDARQKHGLSYYCGDCHDGYKSGVFPVPLPVLRSRTSPRFRSASELYWVLERNGLSHCAKCDRILPREDFPLDATSAHGLNCYCLACHAALGNGKPDKGLRSAEQRARIGAGRREGARRARGEGDSVMVRERFPATREKQEGPRVLPVSWR